MCISNVQNLVNHALVAAQRLSSNTADVFGDAADSGRVPNAGEVASVVDEEVVDHAVAAFYSAVDVFTDDTNWGEAVRIDQGEDPRYFGYGENKETRYEYTAGSTVTAAGGTGPFGLPTPDVVHELAAKLRGFGHDDPDGLSASRGVETEVGYRARAEPGRVVGIDMGAQDFFVGLRGRAVAEHGCLGARAGEELFLGASLQGRAGDTEVGTGDPWWFGEYSADLGVAESAVAEVDVLSADLYAGVRAGLDLRAKARRHDPIYEGLGVVSKTDLSALVGAAAEASASLDVKGLSFDAEAFAGARAGIQQGFAAAYDGTEIIGGFVEAEAWAGAGAKVEADIGYDREEERYHLSGDAGAAVGVGASAGGGVSIATKDFGALFDFGGD